MGHRIAWHYNDFGFDDLIEWRRIRQLGYRHIGGEILGDNFDGKLGGVICWWYDDRHAWINPFDVWLVLEGKRWRFLFLWLQQEPVPTQLLLPRIIPIGGAT